MKPASKLILVLFCLFANVVLAQSSRIIEFNASFQQNSNVLIKWTVGAGSTCNAPQVQHSLNGLNFNTVYTYPGVCGGTDEPESYQWVHASAKQFAFNYYRILLDDGEFTLVDTVDLQSALAKSALVVSPNPAIDRVNLLLRIEANQFFDVHINTLAGRRVAQFLNLIGSEQQLRLPDLSQGMYMLIVRLKTGDVLKSRLMIR
jgi:hypothetical protein